MAWKYGLNAHNSIVTLEKWVNYDNITPKSNLSGLCEFNWKKFDWNYESYKVRIAFVLPLMMSGLDMLGAFG